MSLTTLPNENEISGTGLLMQTDSILQPSPSICFSIARWEHRHPIHPDLTYLLLEG